MKNILLDIRYTDMQIQARQKRLLELVNDFQYNKLFGNNETAKKQARFIFLHDKAIEELKKKLTELLKKAKQCYERGNNVEPCGGNFHHTV